MILHTSGLCSYVRVLEYRIDPYIISTHGKPGIIRMSGNTILHKFAIYPPTTHATTPPPAPFVVTFAKFISTFTTPKKKALWLELDPCIG